VGFVTCLPECPFRKPTLPVVKNMKLVFVACMHCDAKVASHAMLTFCY